MTYKEFKEKYNGKYVDYDGSYGSQCWDLAQYYFTKVLGLPASVLSGCGLVSNMLKGKKYQLMLKYFDVVSIDNAKQGDVAIWEYGHIAIFDHRSNGKNYFFSQNPNPCQVMYINIKGIHCFRLKGNEPKPTPKLKYKIGDKVVVNGKLYKSSNASNPSGSINDRITKITRIAEGSKHPYNTTGDLGWCDENSIKLYNSGVEYFPKCSYNGKSIVDGLKSIKVDSSFGYRKKIANANDIKSYLGLPSQNIKMLNLLKKGKLVKP